MTSRQWSWLMLVGGVVLAFISIFADRIGLGGTPGFGWKQALGPIVGLLAASKNEVSHGRT